MIICMYSRDEETTRGSLLTMHRFVREGEVDRVVDIIRTMADECRRDLSQGSGDR